VEEQKKGTNLYAFLNKVRVDQFNRKSADRRGIKERSLQLHIESMTFLHNVTNVITGRDAKAKAAVMNYLDQQNPGLKMKSRTICLSDATGSMASVWTNAKKEISNIIERIVKIGGKGKSELMWTAYRDYSDKVLVESSEWTEDPALLMKFIEKIECYGGGDYEEAVEIGLKLANDTEGVTRAILIADAPPHKEGKGKHLASHKKTMDTDYLEQSQLLASKNIPVFCFYMNDEVVLVASFKKIAEITSGKAAKFSDTNTLIDIISESVLDDIGGEELVLEYRKTYHS